MKTDPLETVPKLLELAATNLARTGAVPLKAYLWVMKNPETGQAQDEPGVLALPPVEGDLEAWFREAERTAIANDAVAAILVTEMSRPRERHLVVQYEHRGQPTRLWRGRIRERRGKPTISQLKPDTRGQSTMKLLRPAPSEVN